MNKLQAIAVCLLTICCIGMILPVSSYAFVHYGSHHRNYGNHYKHHGYGYPRHHSHGLRQHGHHGLRSDTRTLNITNVIKGLGFTKVTDTLGIIIIHVLYGIINDRPFGTLAIGKNITMFHYSLN